MNRTRSSFDQKPPLPVSPRRLRSRRGRPEPAAAPAAPPTLPVSPAKETQHPPRRSCDALPESPLKTEYEKISRELRSLTKRAPDNFPNGDALRVMALSAQPAGAGVRSSPIFERGRLYEVYSARRNERLKRKMAETFEEEEPEAAAAAAAAARRSAADADVVVKRRSTARADSLRMSAPKELTAAGRTPSLRSSVRSSTRESKMASVLKYEDGEGRPPSARSGRCK